ncbi:CorA family divalent cation transporter [Luteolibacter flavescens]|uniref:CorA family divalent cation transporter n=1 Tax=Luteolibacter flavescens TaxID=1859460 RepID=A0ABT3FJI6_9BACT|nr:CorA family divalent cation transporter [Luteolibacter flavescens]MCW1883726.1 CorA family divalent cation transporter [Luteolibacter flavescens]
MSKSSEFPYLPAGFDLEPELLDQLSNRPGAQRCVIGRYELLLVVHAVPKCGSPDRDPILFWRRGDDVWVDSSGKRGLLKIGELLDHYARVIDKYEDVIDEADTAQEVFELARAAGPLARATRNLAGAIEQTLANDEDNRDLRNYRDRAREVERAAEQLAQDARLTLEFWKAEHSEEQQATAEKLNQIAFRLNLLAGFFLPLVALGGLFGMNVDLPDFVDGWFWLIFCGGLAMGGTLVWLVARKTGLKP